MTSEMEEMVDGFAEVLEELGLSTSRLVDVENFPPFDGTLGRVSFMCECGNQITMDPVDIGDTLECGSCGKNWIISVGVCALEVR